MKPRAPLSIRLRLVGLVLACETALIAASGAVVFYQQSRVLTRGFDSGLRSNAESLATLLQYDAAAGSIGLDFSDKVMERFSRRRHPELFAVLGADGATIDSSRSMKKIPGWVEIVEDDFVRDFRHDGHDYRGIVLPTVAESDDGMERTPVVVFYAANRGLLDDRLEDSASYSALLAAAFLLLSAGTVWWATGRGLAPIGRLAEMTRAIDERSLESRFAPRAFPRELRPLARDFNGLLERLANAFERERRFSADAAHELRTPIASLKAGIQAAQLQGGAAQDTAGTDLMNDLFSETERLESLCESLLELASAEAPRPVPEIPARTFEEEVRDAASFLAARSGRSVAVETTAVDDAVVLKTCDVSARRIVANLVGNALRYAGEGATVRVGIAVGPAGAVVAVEDDGPGLPEEVSSRVFERFFRVDKHRARPAGGAGLGLPICRALARSEGGDMTYEAVMPRGCRFVWRIAAAK